MKKTYIVSVLEDFGTHPTYYKVKTDSPDDAMLLTFAIDGGFNRIDFLNSIHDNELDGQLELAKMYCKVEEIK